MVAEIGDGDNGTHYNGDSTSSLGQERMRALELSQSAMGDEDEDDDDDDDDQSGDDGDEDDLEQITVVSLFDDTVFVDVPSMLMYIKDSYGFDLAAERRRLGLDFLGMVKLVNFVRHEVKEGRGRSLDLSKSSIFDEDRYLRPVLEDDALLFNLDDIVEGGLDQQQVSNASLPAILGVEEGSAAYVKITELHQDLLQSQQDAIATQKRLELAEKALSHPQDLRESDIRRSYSTFDSKSAPTPYQGNYDGAELHRIMLADKPRTDAYRDFILNNKLLFKDKVVLDVGCGTGILSMFCADAGAKVVYAVEQSEQMYLNAIEIILDNGKQDVIKVIHGRIQDVSLPFHAKGIDIIVSEWMGYCLLFEAMLDSVIFARDKWLKPDGLMLPSKATISIAPLTNPEYRSNKLSFWDDFMGYTLKPMKKHVLDSVDVDTLIDETHLAGTAADFISFDLQRTTVEDLSFHNSFRSTLTRDVQLDGFAVWYTVTFSAPRTSTSTSNDIVLSTNPANEPTHWRQGLFLIDRKGIQAPQLKVGECVEGKISYKKEGVGREGLDIGIEWRVVTATGAGEESAAGAERGTQEWKLH